MADADNTLSGLIAASTVAVILGIGLIALIVYYYFQRSRREEEDKEPIQTVHHQYQQRYHPRTSYTTHAQHTRERPALTFFTVRGSPAEGVPYTYRPPIGYPTPVLVLDEEDSRPRRKGHGSSPSTVRDRERAYAQNFRMNGAPGGVLVREMESGEERMDFESSEAERVPGRLYESNRGRSKSRDRHRGRSKTKERARSRSKSRDRIEHLKKSKSDDKYSSRRSRDSNTIMAKEGDIILAPANSLPNVNLTRSASNPAASHIISNGPDLHVSRISHIKETTATHIEEHDVPVSNGIVTHFRHEPEPDPEPVVTIPHFRPEPDPPREPSPVPLSYTIYQPEVRNGHVDLGESTSSSLFKQTTPRADYLFESTSDFQRPLETPREDYNSPRTVQEEEQEAVDSAFSFMNVERDALSSSQQDVYPARPSPLRVSPRPPTPPYDGEPDSAGLYSYTRRIPTPPIIEESSEDGDYNRIRFRPPTPPPGRMKLVTEEEAEELTEESKKGSMREKIIGKKDSPIKNAVIDELMKRRQQGGGNSPPAIPTNRDSDPVPSDFFADDVSNDSRRAVQFTMSPPEIIPRGQEPESPQSVGVGTPFETVSAPPPPPPPPSTNL